jgi:DNA repair protein RadA/Sms
MARRAQTVYVCSACGHSQSRWAGLCPSCGEGGSFEEQVAPAERAKLAVPRGSVPAADFVPLAGIETIEHERIGTGIGELDRVLGGGLVPGSYLVLAGEPGAGKTTLASELLIHLASEGHSVAYVSGEESASQARMRFERLGGSAQLERIQISTETSVERLCEAVRASGYELVVVDSVQTMFSEGAPGAPGSVSQVRECGQQLLRASKESGSSVLLVGQVTKGGEIAGPRTLEHMVDVVLGFEGDRREQLRILRAVKNRFGSTDEIGVFEMGSNGLEGIADPSRIFLAPEEEGLPGTAVACVIEGTRPLLCEVQALVSPSNLTQPIRAARGLDTRRVQMLLAVLQRKGGYPIGSLDIHINVAGGLRIDEPGADLAVCLAVASAIEERPLAERSCAFGEVSLLGLVRPAPQAERRSAEARRLGYEPLEVGSEGLRDIVSRALADKAAVA